jgi:hypothetical protein
MYSIPLNDNLVRETRQSFADDATMNEWLQQKVELMLCEFNAIQQTKKNARKAIEAMRRQSEANGNAGMSLADINNEIRLARETRRGAV